MVNVKIRLKYNTRYCIKPHKFLLKQHFHKYITLTSYTLSVS